MLRRESRPHLISDYLNEEMMQYLEFVPLMMAMGTFTFHLMLYDFEAR